MENDLPPDIAELAKQARERIDKMEAARAVKPSGGVFSKIGELHEEGYTPAVAGTAVAVGAAKYMHGKYQSNLLANLKMIRNSVDAERNLVRTLQSGAGGISDSGKTIVDRANRSATPARGGKFRTGATSRLGTVMPNTTGVTGGVSGMSAKEKIALAKRMTAQQMVRAFSDPFNPSSYAETRTALQNPSAQVSTVEEGKGGKTRTTVTAADVKANKLLPKELSTGQKVAQNLGKSVKWVWDKWGSKWVQVPLRWVDAGMTAYNIPKTFADEQRLTQLQKEGKAGQSFLNMALGDSELRPYLAVGGKVGRVATNFATRFVPEMLGVYDAHEKLGIMYTGIIEREKSEFEKKNGRPMNKEESDALLDAISMSGISIGG